MTGVSDPKTASLKSISPTACMSATEMPPVDPE
jgi:hypothetical protein